MEQEEITEGQSAEGRTAAVEALHSSSKLFLNKPSASVKRWKAEPIKSTARGVQTASKGKNLNTNLIFFIEHNVFLLQLFLNFL